MDEDAVEAGGTAEEEAVFFSESEFADAFALRRRLRRRSGLGSSIEDVESGSGREDWDEEDGNPRPPARSSGGKRPAAKADNIPDSLEPDIVDKIPDNRGRR